MHLHIGILKEALKQAELSQYYPYRHSTVIFNKAKVIVAGRNNVRSNGMQSRWKTYNESLHSEQAALLNYKNHWTHLRNCDILNLRLNPSGNLAYALPCPMCTRLLQHLGLRWCYFSNRDGEISRVKIKDIVHPQ